MLATIMKTDEMCKIDFDGKRADHGKKEKVVCVRKLLALGSLYCMWRRKDSSACFFKQMQVESGIGECGYILSPVGQTEIKPDDPIVHACVQRMIDIACKFAPNWSLKLGGEKGSGADVSLKKQFAVRLEQTKLVETFRYSWINVIFDTDLVLDLDKFNGQMDYRINSWIFSNARDLRSKLRSHFIESVKAS